MFISEVGWVLASQPGVFLLCQIVDQVTNDEGWGEKHLISGILFIVFWKQKTYEVRQ